MSRIASIPVCLALLGLAAGGCSEPAQIQASVQYAEQALPNGIRYKFEDQQMNLSEEVWQEVSDRESAEEEALLKAQEETLARLKGEAREKYLADIKMFEESTQLEKATHAILIGDVQQAVEWYVGDHKELPENLQVLVERKYLTRMPFVPKGKALRINGKTLEVTVTDT